MKTVLVSTSPEWMGGYWRIHFLGRYIKEMGHDVELICANSQPSSRIEMKVNYNMNVTLLPSAENKINKWIISQPYIITASIIKILSRKSDVFHYFSCINPVSISSEIVHKSIRAINLQKSGIVMDWEDWWWAKNDGIMKHYPPIFRKAGRILEEMGPKLADKVTVVSDCLGNRAKEIGIAPEKIFKVPNGANTEDIKVLDKEECRKELNIPLDREIICHIGFTDMVDAFLEVKKEFPDALLYIVGHKPNYAHLRIKNLKEHKDIIYTGRVDLDIVNKYLCASDVACINMGNEVTEDARWPIRFGDYMSAGATTIAGNIGEVGKILNKEKIGFAYKPGDNMDFGEKIKDGLKKSIDPKKIRKIAEKYSWRKISERLLEVYVE